MIKVGTVNFLNTKPLIGRLEKARDRFEMVYDTPARCARMLEERAVDIAILPAVEYASAETSPEYSIIPGISISSRGNAGSVLLFSKEEIGGIRTIALDRSSRTSAALLRVLCREKFKIDPRFSVMPPDLGTMLSESDAALLIGDRALFAPEYFKETIVADLGREWAEMTSLPFVFAFWAGYSTLDSSSLRAFLTSREEGMKRFQEISEKYSFQGRTYPALSREYLAGNMSYSFGEEEKKGLELFYDLCLKHGLIRQKPALRFYNL